MAKLFAGILGDLGLLSKGEVVLRTASDFVGAHLGESERKTKAILKASEGCVLVIDEAYSLGGGAGSLGGKGGGSGDIYRTAVVDTLVEQVGECSVDGQGLRGAHYLMRDTRKHAKMYRLNHGGNR